MTGYGLPSLVALLLLFARSRINTSSKPCCSLLARGQLDVPSVRWRSQKPLTAREFENRDLCCVFVFRGKSEVRPAEHGQAEPQGVQAGPDRR